MAYTAASDNASKLSYSAPENKKSKSASSDADSLNAMANQAGQKLSGVLSSTYNGVSHARANLTREIRTNPVRSSVIALGAGYVLAALLRR